MDTNIIERNESCCSGSITQTEDKYIKSRSEIIDGIVYNINSVWFCQYHLTHFIRTRIMQRERYDHSRAFFGLPEAAHRWRCRFFC